MGRCRDDIATGTDGPYLGPERDRVVADLSQAKKDRLRADIRIANILLQGLPRDIYKLINHNTNAKDIWDNVKMLLEGFELTKDDRESQLYDVFKHFGVQGNNARGAAAAGNEGAQYRADLDEEQLLFLAGGQSNTFDDEVDEGLVQDMAQNEDNIFQADQFYDEAGPSYDFDTLSEVQDHDNCLDNMNESHEDHEIHNDVQPNNVVDSDIEYMSNSNIISYEHYVQDNEDQDVHSDVSFVPNDAVMIITNDIYDHDAQCVTPNNTVNASLTAKLARYKELAEAKALKEQAKSAKPITTMTVYPPNTTAKMVPKVLPTKSQEMKEVFDQMEAEVDEHAVDKKCDKIERKNILIENENLIAKCLSKDVFYTATDSVLIVSRFSDMHDAYTVAQKHIAELEAKNSNMT
nr:hypothetical protein [Tanacetum cinerariifolium]